MKGGYIYTPFDPKNDVLLVLFSIISVKEGRGSHVSQKEGDSIR